jgi:hypothetical protein
MEYEVMTGGLMRCCLATLDATMQAAEKPPREGDMIRCRYCSNSGGGMIFQRGQWQLQKLPDVP